MDSLDLDGLNSLIEWKLDRYAERVDRAKKGDTMQDQITIELRVDFADKDKVPELIKIACAGARHLVANVMLLGPVCKPECVIFTDNFMSAPQKIDIYSDLIARGEVQLKAIANSGVSGAVTDTVSADNDQPSSELLAAMKGN